MALELTKEAGRIFRIEHVDNVAWILENGMHARNGTKFNPKCRSMGNNRLIERRSSRIVPVGPGGTLSDYVPFYFTPFSIMLFNIRTGHSVKHVPNDEIVIFVSSLARIAQRSLQFVFTNQHAYTVMAEYFTRVDDLDRIDWGLLQSRNFSHDPDDPGKKERYQAEALVWKHVPVEGLEGVCCHSPVVEERIKTDIEKLRLSFRVAVRPGWYFQ